MGRGYEPSAPVPKLSWLWLVAKGTKRCWNWLAFQGRVFQVPDLRPHWNRLAESH